MPDTDAPPADDDPADDDTLGAHRPRFAEVALDDAAVLIYDRDNEDAWIESSVAHPLGEAV